MATYFARKSGNINAADVWATTPSGTASNLFPTFTNADVLMANNFTITINVDTTVSAVRGDTFGGATNGGQFALNSGRKLTANVSNGSNYCVSFSQAGSATIEGNVSNLGAIVNSTSGTGTLNIIGNVSGTTNVGARTDTSFAVLNITGNVTGGAQMGVLCQLGTVNINGNVTGGTTASIYGVHNAQTGTVNVTGIVTGGNASSAFGIRNESTGIVNINGIAIGGSGLSAASGVSNASTGNVFLKRAVGNGFGPGSTGLAAAVGLTNAGSGFVSIEELEFGTLGMSPVSGGGIRLNKTNTNVAVFNYCDTAGAKTLIDATQNAAMPAASDVRLGVSYASGAQTGSCAVPAAGSVALGVPVDNTTGTAVLTPAAIRSELSVELNRIDATISSRLAPSGTLATVTNLTNAPASVTPADIWSHATRTITGGTVDTLTNAPSVPSATTIASQVRTELSTELNRLDATVSSRLASASYTAPANSDIAAIKTKTDALPSDPADQSLLEAAIAGVTAPSASTVASAVRSELSSELAKVSALNTDRLAQCSTVATTGSQLAAALS